MYTTGHNSYQGCWYCKLNGIYEKYVYYPTIPPKNTSYIQYNPESLPKIIHQDYLLNIQELNKAKNNAQKKQLEKKLVYI